MTNNTQKKSIHFIELDILRGLAALLMIGYIIGVAAMHYKGFIETHRLKVVSGLFMLGTLPAIAGLILSQRGASFFRFFP
jgi:uncharacterized membrane protein